MRTTRAPRLRGGVTAALVALLCLAAATPAASHPHVWTTVACVFQLDADRHLVAIRQEWTFDAMYSSYAVVGLDADGDGRYSAAELKALRDEMVEGARAERFYTKLALDDAETPAPEASDAELRVDAGGAVALSFVQRFADPPPLAGKSLRIEVRDPTFFVDFQFSKDRFGALEPPAEGCSTSLKDSQPPKGASPDDLMRALIDGPVATLASGVTLRCR